MKASVKVGILQIQCLTRSNTKATGGVEPGIYSLKKLYPMKVAKGKANLMPVVEGGNVMRLTLQINIQSLAQKNTRVEEVEDMDIRHKMRELVSLMQWVLNLSRKKGRNLGSK